MTIIILEESVGTYEISQDVVTVYETENFGNTDGNLDRVNLLVNGDFGTAQRQTPGTLTTISNAAYGPDGWRMERENAELQYIRVTGDGESGITSRWFGRFKKITNAGQMLTAQVIPAANAMPLQGSVALQVKARASVALDAWLTLVYSGAGIDTPPGTICSGSWSPGSVVGAAGLLQLHSKRIAVTTSWQTFSTSATISYTSMDNLIVLISTGSMSVNATLDLAEAVLHAGATVRTWHPRLDADEFRLCRSTYCKSYERDTAPGTASKDGYVYALAGSTSVLYPMAGFGHEMAFTPTCSIYSYDGTAGKVSNTSKADVGSGTVTVAATKQGITTITDASAPFSAGDWYLFHYVAAASL